MTPKEFLAQPTRKYGAWFGEGDSHDDYKEQVARIGSEPEEVLVDGNMLALVWPDLIVVAGYDGNEYRHVFQFEKGAAR